MKKVVVFMVLITVLITLNSCAILAPKAGINLAEINSKQTLLSGLPGGGGGDGGGDTGDGDTDDDSDLPTRMSALKRNNQVTTSLKSKENKTGFYVGMAFSDISITKSIKVQPEVNFIGVKDYNQIQVPILLKYNFGEKISAYTGPNFGLLLDAPTGLNTFNFSLDLGVSYSITEKFLVGIRYDYGVSNLLKNGNSNNYLRVNNLQIGAAYKLNFKK